MIKIFIQNTTKAYNVINNNINTKVHKAPSYEFLYKISPQMECIRNIAYSATFTIM